MVRANLVLSIQKESSRSILTLVIGDGDLVLLSCALIYSRNIEDAIGINVKSNLNLRDPTGCWRDACELELSKQVVVLGHGPFTFIHLSEYTRLVITVGGECLCLLGGDGGIALDEDKIGRAHV